MGVPCKQFQINSSAFLQLLLSPLRAPLISVSLKSNFHEVSLRVRRPWRFTDKAIKGLETFGQYDVRTTTMKKLILLLFITLASVSIVQPIRFICAVEQRYEARCLASSNGRFAIQLTQQRYLPVNPVNNRNQSTNPSNTTPRRARLLRRGDFPATRDIERIEIDGRSLTTLVINATVDVAGCKLD